MSEYKIKRFVLMAGHVYYASGGFQDYKGSFDTKEEAEAKAKEWLEGRDYVWSHIDDLETGEFWGKGEGCNPMKLFQ